MTHYKTPSRLIALILILSVFGLVATAVLMPTDKPTMIEVVDLQSTSATLVWRTNRKVLSKTLIAQKPGWHPNVGFWFKSIFGFFPKIKKAEDIFTLNGQPSVIHMAKIDNLKPGTSYEVVVVNGLRLYKVNNLLIKTRPEAKTIPKLQAAFGQVVSSNAPIANALVLIYKDSDPTVKLSTLTDSAGFWFVNVAGLDLSVTDRLSVEAFTRDGQHKKMINQAGFYQPALLIDFNPKQ